MKFIPTLTKIDFNSTGYLLKQNCIPFQKDEVEKKLLQLFWPKNGIYIKLKGASYKIGWVLSLDRKDK